MRDANRVTCYDGKFLHNEQIRTLKVVIVPGNDNIIDNELYTTFEIIKIGQG